MEKKEEVAEASDHLPLITGRFGAVFVSYGIVLQAVAAWLDRRTNDREFAEGRRMPERKS